MEKGLPNFPNLNVGKKNSEDFQFPSGFTARLEWRAVSYSETQLWCVTASERQSRINNLQSLLSLFLQTVSTFALGSMKRNHFWHCPIEWMPLGFRSPRGYESEICTNMKSKSSHTLIHTHTLWYIHVLIPANVTYVAKNGGWEFFVDVIKYLKMERLSCITWVDPECSHMYLYKRKIEIWHT